MEDFVKKCKKIKKSQKSRKNGSKNTERRKNQENSPKNHGAAQKTISKPNQKGKNLKKNIENTIFPKKVIKNA